MHEEPKTLTPSVTIGFLEILPTQHIVRLGGKEIFFPKKEFDVLTSYAVSMFISLEVITAALVFFRHYVPQTSFVSNL